MRIHDVVLDATVADHRKGPREGFPQVAFAGRSNVGKSSLLNVLFGHRLAAVSKQPGKTRTINYYRVNDAFFLVDLPGYGYAKVAKTERAAWGERITDYIAGEERLRLVVGLVDPRIPTSGLDVDLVEFVRSKGRALLVVMTKVDHLGPGALAQARRRLTRDLGLTAAPVAFSARSGQGTKELLSAIAAAVAA